MNDYKIKFRTFNNKGQIPNNIREIKQSDIRKCKFLILVLDHYRPDGSCKCSNKEHREMMIKEWGYSKSQFKSINLID